MKALPLSLQPRVVIPIIIGVFILALFSTEVAAAATGVPRPQSGLALPSIQFWSLAIGSLVPLVTYQINHHAPWASEHVKAIVLVVLSAVAGALYQLIQAGSIAFDTETFQVVLSAVLAALGAHKLLYLPSGISAKLGGGSNAPLPK